MADSLVMLALSPTMEQGTIAQWLKNEGDTIESGDVLCEVETDKATMEYENTSEGVLLKILAPAGSQVKVGEPIAIYGEEGEDTADLEKTLSEKKSESAPQSPDSTTEGPDKQSSAVSPAKGKTPQSTPQNYQEKTAATLSGKVPASPLARAMAQERGIDLGSISGTGPGGRIVKRDIEQYTTDTAKPSSTNVAAPLKDEIVPVSEKRRVIAQRLSESFYTSPHFFLKNPVYVDELLGFRTRINAKRENKISMSAFLVKLTAEALKRHPMVNATWNNTEIIMHGSIDIAMAVAQKDGLITPVVRNCQNKGIAQIDAELKDLITRARSNQLSPEEYTNSTFTISNLGTAGIREFTAIINPPNAAILAVGSTHKEPFVTETNDIEIRQTMTLSLSADHRILDGAVAAQFFVALKELFEDPAQALL